MQGKTALASAAEGQMWNNPQLAAFAGFSGEQALDLSELPTETAVGDEFTNVMFTPQGPENTLAILRRQFPFVPILPFPPQMASVTLVANVPQDIVVPDFVMMVIFRGSSDYYVSHLGNAEIPTTNTAKSMYRPDGIAFYTGGIKSFSVIAPAACNVTLLGYAPTELPRYGR